MTTRGRLAGKVAIITGGARGMGAAEAALFVGEGAFVMLTDIDDEHGAALAATLGDQARYLHHDVANMSDWTTVVKSVEAEFGRVDILVNNAGISRESSVDDFDPEQFDLMVGVNQRGIVLGMGAVVDAMRRASGGSIVNIASIAGLRGEPDMLAYTGTKFAIRGMSQVAAAELAQDNIRVNVVNPGVIDTPMHQQNSPERMQWLAERIPLKRFGRPDEIAHTVLFLASDESSYITGSEITVDGGILLNQR